MTDTTIRIRLNATETQIEPTRTGYALIQGDVHVELEDILAERFVVNVLGGQRRGRTGATA